MKKVYSFATVLALMMIGSGHLHAQDCNCPPIKLYVYDTRIDFPLSKAVAGEYVEAQNSGDWLEGLLLKQQSEEFKVYKGIKPGERQGNTYELPPTKGDNPEKDVDFTCSAQISRTGDSHHYNYSVAVGIVDVYTSTLAVLASQFTNDLAKVDNAIEDCITKMGPILDRLRNYQKELRHVSDNTKWIYLKYQVKPEKEFLKPGDKTKVSIKIFDCVDQKPAANQKVQIKQLSPDVGILNVHTITTNNNGEAVVFFTAKKSGQTIIFPDMTFTSINDKAGYHVLECGRKRKIVVVSNNKRNYFNLKSRNISDSTLYELKEPLMASSRALQETAYYVNGQWNIGATGFQKLNDNDSVMRFMAFGVSIKGNGTGTYQWSVNGDDKTGLIPPCNTVTVNGTGSDGSPFQYSS